MEKYLEVNEALKFLVENDVNISSQWLARLADKGLIDFSREQPKGSRYYSKRSLEEFCKFLRPADAIAFLRKNGVQLSDRRLRDWADNGVVKVSVALSGQRSYCKSSLKKAALLVKDAGLHDGNKFHIHEKRSHDKYSSKPLAKKSIATKLYKEDYEILMGMGQYEHHSFIRDAIHEKLRRERPKK